MIVEIIAFLVLVTLLYVLLSYVNHILNLKKYPPGPFPLPLIGNLHLIGMKPYELFAALAKVYGDVFSISIGMERIVVINSIVPAKEALIQKGNHFAGRPSNNVPLKLMSRNNLDIACADYGPYWITTRKLGHSALKMFGDGLGNIEKKVIKESEEMHSRLNRKLNQPVNMHHEFGVSVLNIVCSMVFGNRYDINDPEFQTLIKMMKMFFGGFKHGDPVSAFPWLRFLPLEGISKIKKAVSIRDPFYHKKLAEHKETYDPNNIRDFTDSLIQCSKDEEVWKKSGMKEINDDQLEMILNDLFIAGSETTTTTLQWLIIHLLYWPQYQDEMYEEIIQVIGRDRYPELNDRPSLNLVQAVIQETLRLSSIGPLALPHKCTEEDSIGGNNIPKNTQIIFNLWAMHHDDREWNNPNDFNPYRWLDEDKNYIPGKHRSFLPFSTGRRVCLGESLAKTELFLFVSRLMRDFKFEPNNDEAFPRTDGQLGLTLTPYPFTVRPISRNI